MDRLLHLVFPSLGFTLSGCETIVDLERSALDLAESLVGANSERITTRAKDPKEGT